jgi:ribose 5-phosphate isomerase B
MLLKRQTQRENYIQFPRKAKDCGFLCAAWLGETEQAFKRSGLCNGGLIIYNRASFSPKQATTIPSTRPRIAIGSDHAGFSVKEAIRTYLESAGYAVSDLGTSSEQSVDYSDYGQAVGKRVVSRQADFGIAVCGTGIGISIAANKVPGVRAALAHDLNTARLAREHNDANVLALGGPRRYRRSGHCNGASFPDHGLPWRPPPTPPRQNCRHRKRRTSRSREALGEIGIPQLHPIKSLFSPFRRGNSNTMACERGF